MKRLAALFMALCFTTLGACTIYAKEAGDYTINLNNGAITVNGGAISSSSSEAVYKTIVQETHDGVPEALKSVKNTVINITEAGTYRITGSIDDGQIYVNAGDTDNVTLVLDGANINCRTAPALLVTKGYDPKTAGEAGVTIRLADNSTNNISGSYNAESDAAVSSDVSIKIEGGGTLNITSDNEGIETKQHLTIDSGNIVINSADDAINGSEDGISHIMINGGYIYANTSLGKEGDGIDSNGYLTINGGTVVALAHPTSQDGGLDADLGVFINGGTVVGTGNMLSEMSGSSTQQYMQLSFATKQEKDTLVTITDAANSAVIAFKAPHAFTSIVFSSPNLKEGTYYAYTGGDISGDLNNGVYTNITSFENGVKQQHFGNSGGMMGGMGRSQGIAMPEGTQAPQGQMGERREGMPEPSSRTARRAMPEGMATPPEGMGTPPEGMTRPDGTTKPNESVSTVGSTEFRLSSSSKNFNGVTAG